MNSASVGSSAFASHSYYCGSAGGVLSAAANSVTSTGNWTPSAPSHTNGLQTVFDYYGTQSIPEYYGYGAASMSGRYENAGGSTGTPSPHSFENGCWGNPAPDQLYSQLTGNNLYAPYQQPPPKKRTGANSKKERRRTISINGAFSNLRDCIPNVPKDTKLSKIKTLRLACGYIQHLMNALESDSPQELEDFKADLSRKTPCRAEKRKCIEAEIAAAADRKARGRSGWPQTIWAQDLKGSTHPSSTTAPSYLPSMHQQAGASTSLTPHIEHHHINNYQPRLAADNSGEAALLPSSQIKSEVTDMLCSDSVDSSDLPPSSCQSSLCDEVDGELSPPNITQT